MTHAGKTVLGCLSILLLGACTADAPGTGASPSGQASRPADAAASGDFPATDAAAPLPAAQIAELPTGEAAAAGPLDDQSAGTSSAAERASAPLPDDELAPQGAAAAADEGFDPEDIPESDATLPPFPMLDAPPGLESAYREVEREVAADAQYFLAGDRALRIEGRIFRDKFHLGQDPDRPWTALRFHRHYEDAIGALGGRRIDRVQYTREVAAAAGGRATIEKHQHGAVAVPDYRHDSYLLRSGGREYWIDVSTGSIPLHGFVVVLERAGDPAAGAAGAAGDDRAGDPDTERNRQGSGAG